MSKFLHKTALTLFEKHNGNFQHVIVVLPGRRAILFLQKHLGQLSGKSFWLPQSFILPEFIQWITKKTTASGMELMLELYQCYRKAVAEPSTFDVFSLWAATALKDFGDIDRSLADGKSVFSNLKNIKEIEGWSFNSEALTNSQLQFIAFWEDLGKLYHEYSNFQKENDKWSYNALVKWAAENESAWQNQVKGKTVYFVGMASFSAAELALIQKLSAITTVEVIWDLDEYYVNDAMHEAGYFARKYKETFKTLNGVSNQLATTTKRIHINETTTSIGQCYGVAEALTKLTTDELDNTCVVIADEKLAEPFLSAISSMDATVNLAIGIPLGTSTQARWIESMLRIKQKMQTEGRGIYYKDFIEWTQLCLSVGLKESEITVLKNAIISGKWIYVTPNQLKQYGVESGLFQRLLDVLLEKNMEAFILQIRILILASIAQDELTEFDKASAQLLVQILDNLSQLMKKYDFVKNQESLQVLWSQLLSTEKLQYEGEPLSGLQILGLAETRALDFENIYVLGANEETLPGNAFHQTFIPYELRGYYKLPMPTEHENMLAYAFYRLLQYPTNVNFYSSTISSDFKGTEQSRYITQLESELIAANNFVTIERHQLKMPEPEVLISEQSAANDEFAKGKLDKLFEYGISPSAINKFNTCPLDFYYRYILGLGEEDVVEEQMSSATFGSVVHYVLEKFYENYKESYPNEANYEELKTTLDKRLETAFAELYSIDNASFGFNYLARVVAKDMLVRIINFEKGLLAERIKEDITPKLIATEMMLSKSVNEEKYDWSKPIKLRGKVDRIEDIAGIVHILDYKTGKVEDKDIKLNKPITQLFADDKNGKLLQLLCYIYMYKGDNRAAGNITAGFYSFIEHRKGFMMLDETMTEAKLQEFEVAFVDWVKQLYAIEKFEHNPNSKYCQYCS